jgi:hypothetical protein
LFFVFVQSAEEGSDSFTVEVIHGGFLLVMVAIGHTLMDTRFAMTTVIGILGPPW